MRRQTSPVPARYLLARLRPLTRPIFWGPTIALMFVVLFTWQYWMRPEWVSYFGVKSSSGDTRGLSAEDRAIGADIDTLPMLFNDFAITNSASKQTNPAKSDLATSTDLAKLPQIPIPGSAIAPPASGSVGNSNVFGNVFGATAQKTLLPEAGSVGSLSTGETANSSQPQNPNNLSSVLNLSNLLGFPMVGTSTEQRSTAPTNYGSSESANRPAQTPASFTSIAPSAPIAGTTSLGSFGVNAASPATTPYTNSYSSLVEGIQPLPIAGVVPIAPISPLSTQPLPILSPQPLSNAPSVNGVPNPLAPQSPQTLTNDVPFTAPRPIPGRVLGGGQINTFSNP